MTYAIGYIVYGVDLQGPSPYDRSAVDEFADFRDEIEELSEGEIITTQYSGGGEAPEYFGVDLGQINGNAAEAVLEVRSMARQMFLDWCKTNLQSQPLFSSNQFYHFASEDDAVLALLRFG